MQYFRGRAVIASALSQEAEMLRGMLVDAGVENFDMLRQEDPDMSADDPIIDDIIRFMITDLAEEGSLHCGCKETSYRCERARGEGKGF